MEPIPTVAQKRSGFYIFLVYVSHSNSINKSKESQSLGIEKEKKAVYTSILC
jgi:hypothetical protein